MLGNAIPATVKEVALFFTPPSETQEITLKFHGLENVESVSGIWLVDRQLGNKTTKILPGDEYTFVSEVSDADQSAGNNRFVLRFYDEVEDVITEEKDPITAYYSDSYLNVQGLKDIDLGSEIQIYDMQGRLMGKTKVDNIPSVRYLKPLSAGAYILKITGKRNYTTKFASLKN